MPNVKLSFLVQRSLVLLLLHQLKLKVKARDLIKLYKNDGLTQTIGEAIKPNEYDVIHLKGMVGSLDALIIAALYGINHQNHLIVLHDKEEAAYFHNDLQNLLGDKEVLFFPTSYKRPYEFEETENEIIGADSISPPSLSPSHQYSTFGGHVTTLQKRRWEIFHPPRKG